LIEEDERAADNGAVGSQVVNWQHTLEQKWAAISFGEVKVQTEASQHLFEVQVRLNDLDPKAVRVELCADGITGSEPVRQEMKLAGQLAGVSGGYVYSTAVPAARAVKDYTARIIPHCDGVAIPLENARILWQR
jgi:starch phosphorylase